MRLTAWLYLLLGTLVLAPIFSVRVPCLGDYLNHLARIHILTSIHDSPSLLRFFSDHWQIVPYYGMDLPVAALQPAFGIYGAGRFFVAICVLTPVAAAAALRYAVHGRVGLAPTLAFLLSYNYLLALGFLNYLFSAGLAVLLLAGWIAAAGWPAGRRAAAFVLPALALYFAHVFAFVAYGILIGGYELGRAIRQRRSLVANAANVAAAASQAAAPCLGAVLFAAARTFGAEHVTRYGSLQDRVGALLSPLYFPAQNELLVAAFVLLPCLGVLLAWPPRLAAALLPACLAVLAAALAAPAMLLNVWGTALRLPLVAAMVLVATVSPPPRFGRPARLLVVCVVLALVAARAWTATSLLRRLDSQIASLRDLVTHLPEGARLLVVDGPQNAPGRLAPLAIIQQMSLVATIDRNAFIPMLFTGTTPLQLRPTMRDSASQAVGALSVAQLREGYSRPAPPGPLPPYRDGAQMYWLGWPAKFDDVLVTHFGASIEGLPPNLRRVAGNGVATLYAVEK